jgi:hypothetical protein
MLEVHDYRFGTLIHCALVISNQEMGEIFCGIHYPAVSHASGREVGRGDQKDKRFIGLSTELIYMSRPDTLFSLPLD